MNNKNISLQETLSQLENAIEQQDWKRAEALDQSIKLHVEGLVSQADSEGDNAKVIDILTKIQALYGQLIAGSEQARLKLSVELKKVSNDNKAANFYLKSSQYR